MEAATPTKLADDPMFSDLEAVPAGAVRAYGTVFDPPMPVYVEWQDGNLTGGSIDGVAAIEAAVKNAVEVNLPAVYVGLSSIKTKHEFMATCYGMFRDCEFSEDFLLQGDADVRANLKDPG